jgi:hypothetical protein
MYSNTHNLFACLGILPNDDKTFRFVGFAQISLIAAHSAKTTVTFPFPLVDFDTNFTTIREFVK